MPQSDVIVVGGGAAGLMAAIHAARSGEQTILLEKNEKTGKKLYITGKGRCNFTNDCETEELFSQTVSNAKFLYSAIYGFSNLDVIRFFEEEGLRVKIERGGRVFPSSDKSSDVIRILNSACKKYGVETRLNTEVKGLILHQEANSTHVRGVRLAQGEELYAKRVILATGGLSYPSTGSTGDGLRWAKDCGHSIVDPRPGLTGLVTSESWVRDMQGLTLVNTAQTIRESEGGKKLLDGFGELLFTHYGVSGPTMLTVSSKLGDVILDHPLILTLDIKPGLDDQQLDKKLIEDIRESGRKSLNNLLTRRLPASMIPVILSLANLDPGMRALDLTKEGRKTLVRLMKSLTLTLTGVRSFEEAIITRGGISVRDIRPGTMESKKVSGLYFSGEMIDVDALTGGYNLQIAWSTGALAGRSGNKEDRT